MAISTEDKKILNQLKMNSLRGKLGKDVFSIYEFQNLVEEGAVSDELGLAQLIVNDEIKEEYNVFIDRQCILKAGTIISFWGLLKMYGEENIKIKYSLI